MNTVTNSRPATQPAVSTPSPSTQPPAQPLLKVQDGRIWYTTVAGEAKVVDGVDVTINRNEVFGLAGESGCGKSTLVEGVLRLIKSPGHIKSGQAFFTYQPKD